MTLRKVIFWLHLVLALAAGVVIMSMAVTGMLIAFEPQIVEFSERAVRRVSPAANAVRMSLDSVLTQARQVHPDVRPERIGIRNDPQASVAVSFGREAGTVYVDPYTGDVLGGESWVHGFLHTVEQWHRWLASRDIWRPVTGASNLVFLFLVISGFYLWWPRNWNPKSLKAVTVFNSRLTGKARDWNWHNVIGFWCAPILFITTVTGAIMSYQWANDLLYRATGNEPPPTRERRSEKEALGPEPTTVSLDSLVNAVQAQAPGWVSVSMRFPKHDGDSMSASVQEPPTWQPAPRSQLVFDSKTGAVKKWKPFAEENAGRQARTFVKSLHTGQAGGILGQILAFIGAMGAGFLVWTGFALSYRRFFKRRPIKDKVSGSIEISEINVSISNGERLDLERKFAQHSSGA